MSRIEERIVYRALWAVLFGDHDLTMGRLAAQLPDVRDLSAHVDGLANAGTLEVDRYGGRIYGVWGITLVPTEHSLRIGRRRVYARTLPAAIQIMETLKESGKVFTRCPKCGSRVTLRIEKGRVRPVRFRLHDWTCPFRVGDAIRSDGADGDRAWLLRQSW